MLKNSDITELMKAAAATNPQDLKKAAAAVDDNKVPFICEWVRNHVSEGGVHITLARGCVFALIRELLAPEERATAFTNLLQDLGKSRTQAFRDICVWNRFSKPLLEHPEIAKLFVSESLKLLSAENTQSARDAAITLASRGERITIKRARKLLAEHGCRVRKTNKASSVPKGTWSFVGASIRLTVKSLSQSGADLQGLIADLESFLTELRRKPTGTNSSKSA